MHDNNARRPLSTVLEPETLPTRMYAGSAPEPPFQKVGQRMHAVGNAAHHSHVVRTWSCLRDERRIGPIVPPVCLKVSRCDGGGGRKR